MKHFGGGLRSEGLKRAYALGHRGKAECDICHAVIYNRMQYRVNEAKETIYAHKSCAKTQPQYEWEACW